MEINIVIVHALYVTRYSKRYLKSAPLVSDLQWSFEANW